MNGSPFIRQHQTWTPFYRGGHTTAMLLCQSLMRPVYLHVRGHVPHWVLMLFLLLLLWHSTHCHCIYFGWENGLFEWQAWFRSTPHYIHYGCTSSPYDPKLEKCENPHIFVDVARKGREYVKKVLLRMTESNWKCSSNWLFSKIIFNCPFYVNTCTDPKEDPALYPFYKSVLKIPSKQQQTFQIS